MENFGLAPPKHCYQGYLRRGGKASKALGLKRKRFYKLDGCVLSKFVSENGEAIWHINVLGFDVVKLGRTHFVIVIKKPEDAEGSPDFEENALVLYAKTEDQCKCWVGALKYASGRKLENHFEMGPVIGEGGFAKVRLGRSKQTSELRAIKTMAKSEKNAKLFGTEIAIIKRVSHPNIVQTFDIFETDSEIHIVMEYMKGGMLYEAIEDGVRFKEEDVAQFIRELLDGIYYLHKCGIVHRDIKPENVLCTSKEFPLHVKIADFGLSNIASVNEVMSNKILMSTVIGTPEFVAPEIANRQMYSEKVDMWALGMLIYNVICGRLPIDESQDPMAQIRGGIVLSFPEPDWLEYSNSALSFIRSLLCTDPEKRLSALGSLVHPWLEAQEARSNKVATHGRMSVYLAEHANIAPSPRNRSHQTRTLASQIARTKKSLSVSEIKRLWFVAYISAKALNRFRWIVDADLYSNAAQQVGVYGRRKKLSSLSSLPSDKRDSVASDGESIGSGPPSARIIRFGNEQIHDVPSNDRERKSHSRGSPKSAPILALGGHSFGTRHAVAESPRYREEKMTLRKKFLSVVSSETGNSLSPVRKFSRRIAQMGSERKLSSVRKSAQTRERSDEAKAKDTDFNFDGFDIETVDESGLAELDRLDDVRSTPVHGKKHRALLSTWYQDNSKSIKRHFSKKRDPKDRLFTNEDILKDKTNVGR